MGKKRAQDSYASERVRARDAAQGKKGREAAKSAWRQGAPTRTSLQGGEAMSSSADGLRDDGEDVSKSAKKAQTQMRGISVRVPKEIHDAIFLRKIITGKTITEIVEQTLMRELEADIASLRMLSRGDGDVRPLDAEERR